MLIKWLGIPRENIKLSDGNHSRREARGFVEQMLIKHGNYRTNCIGRSGFSSAACPKIDQNFMNLGCRGHHSRGIKLFSKIQTTW